jgi:apolipoprotein N-acyltransferase
MKKLYWAFFGLSTILYALPFLYSAALWWLIFIFPVPLLYITCTENLSFIHGYIWGIITFALHLHAGILIVANLAGDCWWVGFLMGMVMILYQAIIPALLFWLATKITLLFVIESPLIRILLWTVALVVFIFWTDRYCMWIFDMQGYPFMHPLLPLAQYSPLLQILPIFGKQLLLLLFLLVPVSIVIMIWYKNYVSVLLCITTLMPWIWSAIHHPKYENGPSWYKRICSLPCMIRAHTTSGAVRILGNHIKKCINDYPESSIIIMPESALDIVDHTVLDKLHGAYLQKPLHLIFGACSCENDNYYNSLYWIHDGTVSLRFDKKHAMLITERMADWMNSDWLRKIYFKDDISITRSCNERKLLQISEPIAFIPYICSELFFNEYPDDCYPDIPILAIVNDTLLNGSYMHNLLVLLAKFKAIQWHRDIVYVSYGVSVFINKWGNSSGNE